MSELESILEPILRKLARYVVEELQAGQTDWIDPAASELGRKKHCAAVRRRIAKNQGGAVVIGRRHLLSKEAHAEELVKLSKPKKSRRAELMTELGLSDAN